MRPSRSSSEHREAVSRRLALLGAELSAVRAADGLFPGSDVPGQPPDTHTRIRPHAGHGQPERGVSAPARDPATGPAAPAAHPLGVRPTEPPPSEPRPIPVPGRHAARRRWSLAPETVGSFRLGPAQLSVVAILVAVGLAVTTWWIVRSDATGVRVVSGTAAPLVTPSAEATAGGTAVRQAAAPGATVTDLVVDVAGRVRHPGIAVLAPGSRVIDAIEAAGGARPGVDLSSLNLARPLVDGEQIMVGRRASVAGVGGGSVVPEAAPAALVNLNTAGPAELEALPEVGPVTAQAIIAWREAHGGFTAVDQLLDVDGIGEATLSQLAPLVTV